MAGAPRYLAPTATVLPVFSAMGKFASLHTNALGRLLSFAPPPPPTSYEATVGKKLKKRKNVK